MKATLAGKTARGTFEKFFNSNKGGKGKSKRQRRSRKKRTRRNRR